MFSRLARASFEKIELRAPKIVLRILANVFSGKKVSYSFYGEDLIIEEILNRIRFEINKEIPISYVDIGAWRPIKGSNTYKFYKSGLRGTAVEPNPHFRKLWRAIRPRDHFLEIACSNSVSAHLSIFHPSAASNTLSEDFAKFISGTQNFRVSKRLNVSCMTLEQIILLHKSNHSDYFILDIDIEGLDEEIITSYQFPYGYRPFIILVEDILKPYESLTETHISSYLTSLNYKIVGRTALTSIFMDLEAELLIESSQPNGIH